MRVDPSPDHLEPDLPRAPYAAVDPDAPTIAGSTLFTTLTFALGFVGGIVFAPVALGRSAAALRRLATRSAHPRILAGVVLLAQLALPLLAGVALHARLDSGARSSSLGITIVGFLVASFANLPLFSRLPLLLTERHAEGAPRSLRDAGRRSIEHALDRPVEALLLAALFVGASLLPSVLGLALVAVGGSFVFAMIVTLAALALVVTAVLYVVSARTPVGDPRPIGLARGLRRFGALYALPFALILVAGALATRDPLPVQVVTDGRGVQPVRGMMREDRPRGRYAEPAFSIEGEVGSVVIHRAGEDEVLRAAYDPSAASMVREACSGLGAALTRDCRSIAMRGPDWELRLRVDGEGRRLDDAPLDRALARIGGLGVSAMLLALALVAFGALASLRVRGLARRLAARDKRHRLRGRLLLGEGGRIEGSIIHGESNQIALEEGDRSLRLADRQAIVGIEARLARAAAHAGAEPIPSLVALDSLPAGPALRSMDEPMPEGAVLVVGDPDVIEAEAASRALFTMSPFAFAITLCAGSVGVALAFA